MLDLYIYNSISITKFRSIICINSIIIKAFFLLQTLSSSSSETTSDRTSNINEGKLNI